jgi:hypothetical protein
MCNGMDKPILAKEGGHTFVLVNIYGIPTPVHMTNRQIQEMRNKNNQIKTITTDTDFPLLPTIEVIEKLKKDTGITPIDELQNKVIYIRRT